MKTAKVYMKITTDQYELPIAVADTIKELSEITGNTVSTIKTGIAHREHDNRITPFIRVIVEMEDDEF